MFSPAVDLLFIANLFWPLLLLVDITGGITTHENLLFWQIYFITAPHRWITLILVAAEHDKYVDRRWTFIGFAGVVIAVCLCVQFGTGSLLCLGVVDYIWNAWHFSSQHHGIFRIYERKSFCSSSSVALRVEKVFFRLFMLYTIARVAGWGWQDGPFGGSEIAAWLDGSMLFVPLFFVLRQLGRWYRYPATGFPSVAYLTSVMVLFVAMLAACHYENNSLVIQLALASAVFHSLEYMSIVTWAVQKSKSTTKLFRSMARTWLLFLMVFVLVIGAGNYLVSKGWFEFWVTINLMVAFMHYGFDGMIWKSPKPKTASSVAGQV
ncbi:hypothetical protein FF011L_52760 [Roseimaritima multifibrata]|uniref:Uncharacterized protein n=1 Tax=Roseimaritima multifibrata TaxID=1930274 RepID=A0A517MNK8_9BACT|nr:hypothetical protein [Roseimaritima multifibrata]QDS96465.1 hypothetical protein FF011L_52760 [Roseimaritima multifibrata]